MGNSPKLILFLSLQVVVFFTSAQNVAINNDGSSPHGSAILDVKSGTKGMLIPRTSSASRIAIVNPAKGLILYDTTTSSFWFYTSSVWKEITTGSNGWNLAGNTGTDTSVNFIGTSDAKDLIFKTNNTQRMKLTQNGSIFLRSINSNTIIGDSAGAFNTGNANHFIGYYAGAKNTIGSNNTANGYQALAVNTTGSSNTAFGYYSLLSNNANFNTAFGALALQENTTGSFNTSVGYASLYLNTTGNFNTAIGHGSLYNNRGNNNTAVGYGTLANNYLGSYNVAVGDSALFSQNQTAASNTAIGTHAMFSNTTGSANVALGGSSMYLNSSGTFNTALGLNTLVNNIAGHYNTGAGARALQFTTGDYNTAMGASALRFNSTGVYNTAMGYGAFQSPNTGNENTAIGVQALFTNNSGSFNSSLGVNSMYNNSNGAQNTAIGKDALNKNVSGSQNTAVGLSALFYNENSNNTAVGIAALAFNITGYSNTALGAGADVTYSNLYNATAIGWNSRADDFHRVWIGSTIINSIGGSKGWTTFSDGRYKNAVQDDVLGLDFIKLLRPVSYLVDVPKLNEHYQNGRNNDSVFNIIPGDMESEQIQIVANRRETGFIAQEVEQVAKQLGFSFSGIDKPISERALYGLRYGDFVVPLVKAVQEQQVLIETLQNEINRLKSIEERLAALEKQINK